MLEFCCAEKLHLFFYFNILLISFSSLSSATGFIEQNQHQVIFAFRSFTRITVLNVNLYGGLNSWRHLFTSILMCKDLKLKNSFFKFSYCDTCCRSVSQMFNKEETQHLFFNSFKSNCTFFSLMREYTNIPIS